MFRLRFRYLPGILLVAPLALLSCFGAVEDPNETATDRIITLANHELSQGNPPPLIIIAPGEVFPCDACKVAPGGGFRPVTLKLLKGQTYLFKVYRDNVQITNGSVICKYNGQDTLMVDFDGSKLHCVNWEESSF